MKNRTILALLLVAALADSMGMAQTPQKMTLKEAETIAAQNHPQIGAARLRAGERLRPSTRTG